MWTGWVTCEPLGIKNYGSIGHLPGSSTQGEPIRNSFQFYALTSGVAEMHFDQLDLQTVD